MSFNTQSFDKSWQEIINAALLELDPNYLKCLQEQTNWLPGPKNIFNAFSLPKPKVKVILLGESPYPRQASANGYAFWDASVSELWSETGLSKPVNRATSLRNFIKMLLLAAGLLTPEETNQAAIAKLDKRSLIQTNQELFENLLEHGFLLLNASLVFRPGYVQQDAKAWLPFIETILQTLLPQQPLLLLFGRIAEQINRLETLSSLDKMIAPHPYNLSFIQHAEIINFFRPLTLLKKTVRMKQGR